MMKLVKMLGVPVSNIFGLPFLVVDVFTEIHTIFLIITKKIK